METNDGKKKNEGPGSEGICLRDRERLTDKEQVMLEFMAAHLREHGYPPTIRELCELSGYSSPATTMAHVKSLEKKGFIARRTMSPRAITLL
ncbi:MAG: LexA repressor [Lachnospiraceae bacterium]|nr:LexA repressor [Lachnospiraceae bacterium]